MESTIKRIPAWSLCYIEYGDESGLTDEDVQQVKDFYEMYRLHGMEIQYISPVHDKDENFEEYFLSSPAFGLPGSVVDCHVMYLPIPKS